MTIYLGLCVDIYLQGKAYAGTTIYGAHALVYLDFLTASLMSLSVQAARRQSEEFPKYKQRVTSVCRRFHGAYFEDDPEFDLKNHVRAVTLPEPAGRHELHELVR